MSPTPSIGRPPSSASSLPPQSPRPRRGPIPFKRYRYRKWFAPLIAFVVAASTAAILAGSWVSYSDFVGPSSGRHKDDKLDSQGSTSKTWVNSDFWLLLYGKVIAIDEKGLSVRVSWTLSGCDAINGCSMALDEPINIYVNENATAGAHPNHTETHEILGYDPKVRSFGYDPLAHHQYGKDYEAYDSSYHESFNWTGPLSFYQSFETETAFSVKGSEAMSRPSGLVRSSDLYYPFESYDATTLFLAVNPDTNQTVSMLVFLHEQTTNWHVEPWFRQMETNHTQVTFSVERSSASMAFSGLVFLTNWFLTFASVWQTILVCVYGFEMGESLILVPLTLLFSLPAIRAMVPGPSGSYYDLLGFFLNIVFVSICSVINLVIVLRGREHLWDPKIEPWRNGAGAGPAADDKVAQTAVIPRPASLSYNGQATSGSSKV